MVVEPKTALNKLANKLATKGSRGLLSLAKAFKKADLNKNSKVDFEAYKELCHQQSILGEDIINSDIVAVFQMIDSHASG